MQLEELSENHESAFLKMLADYREHDAETFRARYERKGEWTSKEFAKFVKESEKLKQDWRPKAGKISVTRYVMLGDQGEIRANCLMRFPLDETNEVDGGNLEVDVPPSLRRKGYGSYALALSLFEAVRAGLSRVLVTCPADDVGARKLAELNRGVLADIVDSPVRPGTSIARYWINFR